MTPKKRGPKPKGLPRRTVIAFGVSEEEKAWLTALPNRSEWLRKCIEMERTSADKRTETSAPDSLPLPNAE